MELLVVVAIIGVLVAIAIPLFASQLERSREATDLANIRSAYALVATKMLDDPDEEYCVRVRIHQTQAGWQTEGLTLPANLYDISAGEIQSYAPLMYTQHEYNTYGIAYPGANGADRYVYVLHVTADTPHRWIIRDARVTSGADKAEVCNTCVFISGNEKNQHLDS